MVNLLLVTCFVLVLSMVHGWDFPSTFDESSFPKLGDTSEIKTKLEAVEPECTTTGDSPTTTKCIKQLISDGTKYISEEVKVTDDQGYIISQSSNYQSFSSNTNSNMQDSNTNE